MLMCSGFAAGVEYATGGHCYLEGSQGMAVCWGGKMPTARGGTTYGFTFVSRQVDRATGKLVSLDALMGMKYADLRKHEGVHAKQGEALGVAFPVAYGIAEAVGEHRYPGDPRGCHNIFEQEAGLPEGFYVC